MLPPDLLARFPDAERRGDEIYLGGSREQSLYGDRRICSNGTEELPTDAFTIMGYPRGDTIDYGVPQDAPNWERDQVIAEDAPSH